MKVCLNREKKYLLGEEKNIYACCVGQKPNTRRDTVNTAKRLELKASYNIHKVTFASERARYKLKINDDRTQRVR